MTSLRDLHRLLDLARTSRSHDLPTVLGEVARTVAGVLGYRAVVVNLRRPAWDDFEVVHVEGDEESREALLGTTLTYDAFERAMRPRYERRGAHVLHFGETDEADVPDGFVPEVPAPADPALYHPEDMVLVALRDDDGELLGILSVDEPVSGRRATDEELDFLVAVASHASVAVMSARAEAEARRLRMAMHDLLRVGHRVHDERTLDQTLDDIAEAVRTGLGFERVAVLLAGADGDTLLPRATRGFEAAVVARMDRLTLSGYAPILDPRLATEGCQLVDPETAEASVPDAEVIYDSQLNGRGPRAWRGHWLVVPIHDAGGAIAGLLWADDPEDRLLPDADRLRALRLFADQAAAAAAAGARVAHLRHLADHDPLTGVLNRRDLTERLDGLLAAGGPLSLAFADLDHFKRINDTRGHDVGDAVLRAFGQVLHRHATSAGGLAVRLGGEEFALVLPQRDHTRAMALAEALRRDAAEALGALERGITVSVGVATSSATLPDTPSLLRAADQALYAAKGLGRDRCVGYDPALPALDRRAGDPAATPSLSAVLLLAGTLDARDPSTARHSRTVARLAELCGDALGLDRTRVERLRVAGALHDLGKIAVSDSILRKPGPLDADEWAEIRRHPEVGALILRHAGLDDIATWVVRHHERVDGKGYPAGDHGDELPLEARVLAVCDAFEAMTADRPYRRALSIADAVAELHRCAGTQFDPVVVAAFERALGSAPVTAA